MFVNFIGMGDPLRALCTSYFFPPLGGDYRRGWDYKRGWDFKRGYDYNGIPLIRACPYYKGITIL